MGYVGYDVTTAFGKLTTVKVKAAPVGKHFDGGGLFLDVKPNGSRYSTGA